MTFTIFDTEYTADKGFLEEGFNGWKNREIVQIAALKVNDNLEVIDTMNFYIKPLKHKTLSPYFTNLTGITYDMLEKEGVLFAEAYPIFKKFVGSDICYSHSWSDDAGSLADGIVMRESMAYSQIEDSAPPKYANIAFWFREQYKKKGINITNQASGDIARLLGGEKELAQMGLAPHNAFYDVYSILFGLRHFHFRPQ